MVDQEYSMNSKTSYAGYPEGYHDVKWVDILHAPPGMAQPGKPKPGPRMQLVGTVAKEVRDSWPDIGTPYKDNISDKPGAPSLDPRSNYYRPFKAAFSGATMKNIDKWIKAKGVWHAAWLLGTWCRVEIVHNDDGYANIETIMPIEAQLASNAMLVGRRMYERDAELFLQVFGQETTTMIAAQPLVPVPMYVPQYVDKWGQSALFQTGDVMPANANTVQTISTPQREPVGAVPGYDQSVGF